MGGFGGGLGSPPPPRNRAALQGDVSMQEVLAQLLMHQKIKGIKNKAGPNLQQHTRDVLIKAEGDGWKLWWQGAPGAQQTPPASCSGGVFSPPPEKSLLGSSLCPGPLPLVLGTPELCSVLGGAPQVPPPLQAEQPRFPQPSSHVAHIAPGPAWWPCAGLQRLHVPLAPGSPGQAAVLQVQPCWC